MAFRRYAFFFPIFAGVLIGLLFSPRFTERESVIWFATGLIGLGIVFLLTLFLDPEKMGLISWVLFDAALFASLAVSSLSIAGRKRD